MRIGKRARTATIQLLSGFFFLLIFVVSATSMQDLGGLARQERERRANLSRRSRVYTNEDLARPRIVDPEDRQAGESAPDSAKVVPDEFPAPRPLMIDWPDDIPLAAVARFYEDRQEAESASDSAKVVPDEFPAPRPLVIDWPDDIPLAAVARFYEDRQAGESAPDSAKVVPDEFPAPRPLVIDWPDDIPLAAVALFTEDRRAAESAPSSVSVASDVPAPEFPAPRPLVIDWPEDIPLAAVARFYEDRQAAESAPSSVSVASDVPALELPAPRSLVIDGPEDIPLGDIARFYRKEREKEAAGTPAFAANELSTVDLGLEPWLFPHPLASPLPTTLDSFFPPRGITEPVWDAPQVPLGIVRVERGDTLWKIAERHLGSGNQWPNIAAANPALQDPNHIQPGQQLLLPAQAVTLSGTRIRVQAGDSLWKLAATRLGTGHAWPCLAAANPQIEDANRIYPGQMLVIPATCFAGA